jgi:DNA primase
MDRPKIPFAQIKREVSIASVARRYGFELKPNDDGKWLHGQCRLRSHESKESKTSFAVNLQQNYWVCHSDSCTANRGGKKGGDVITLVHWLEPNGDYYDAAKKLMEEFHVGGIQTAKSVSQPATNGHKPPAFPQAKPEPTKAEALTINVPLKFQSGFKDIDHAHEYLKKRGITPSTAQAFGVGFYGGKSSVIKDPYRIVIPIRNVAGELVAYVGRSLDPELKDKYHFPSGFHKTLELFNLHQVGEQADTVVVVEGFFGTLKVAQAGFPNVVALMGRTLSEAQELLLRRFTRIVLMLDPDGPGREAQAAIVPRLAVHTFVRAVALPDDKQPDLLSSKELQAILNPILG